jgi:hypothetical protein
VESGKRAVEAEMWRQPSQLNIRFGVGVMVAVESIPAVFLASWFSS